MTDSIDIYTPGGGEPGEILAMPGDPADEESGAERGNAGQQQGAEVLRIPLKSLHRAIAVIDQSQTLEE